MYKLYVGSNNQTKKLEVDKTVKVLSANFKGFTYYSTTGFWEGVKEKSLVIEVSGVKRHKIDKVARELCSILKQQAVAVQYIPNEMRFLTV